MIDPALRQLSVAMDTYRKLTIAPLPDGKPIGGEDFRDISDDIHGPRISDLAPTHERAPVEGADRLADAPRQEIAFGLDAGQLVLIGIAGFAIWSVLK